MSANGGGAVSPYLVNVLCRSSISVWLIVCSWSKKCLARCSLDDYDPYTISHPRFLSEALFLNTFRLKLGKL